MALMLKEHINSNCILSIWEITEGKNDLLSGLSLNENEKTAYGNIHTELRKSHWLCSRLLVKELTGKHSIDYDEWNKPFLKESPFKISVSHSGCYVAVIIDKSGETGIDVEKIDSKIERISGKFMSEAELNSLTQNSRFEQIHVFWGAKEALYKVYGKKGLIFKENLLIQPFNYVEEGTISGLIQTDSCYQSFVLRYQKIKDYMLVYVMNC